MKRHTIKIFLITFLLLFQGIQYMYAQSQPPVIQFSGIVLLESDSSTVVPGVHIYVPKAGRGSTTNILGYFSLPVLVGDSVVVSAIGFQKQHFIIPDDQREKLTIIIALKQDTTRLPEVAVFPYPTEEAFKEAFLALELPDQEEIDYMKRNLSPERLAYMAQNTPMDGSENYKFYMQQQMMQQYYGNSIRTNPFFNPLNWARFIQSIKNGDLKQK